MKLVIALLACAAISLFVIACTETVAPTNSPAPSSPTTAASPAKPVDELVRARTNYQKNCESCHGETGEGGLVKVENKRIKVPSLKAAHAIKKTDEGITKMITAGEEEMPSFKDKLSGGEITEMVKFVRKEFQGK